MLGRRFFSRLVTPVPANESGPVIPPAWQPNQFDKVRIMTGPHKGLVGYVNYIWSHTNGTYRFLVAVPFGRICNTVWREQSETELVEPCYDNQHVPQDAVADSQVRKLGLAAERRDALRGGAA